MKKTIITILLVCILTSLVTLTLTGSASKTDTYVLYKNDTKFDFAEYPAVMKNDELLVPSSFFIGFKNVLYEYSEKYQSFYFWNKPTGQYFAFSFNAENIVVNGEYTQRSFPILNSTIYMPLEYCAEILSLKLEYYTEDNVTHVRLYDDDASLDFIELIELFDPIGRLDPKPIEPIDPDEPDKPTEPEKPKKPDKPKDPVVEKPHSKTVYLALKLSDADYAKDAISLLSAYGERATLLFDKELLLNHPKEVFHATVGGNAVGIMVKDSTELTEQALDDTNLLLKHIANFSARLYLSENGEPAVNGYTPIVPTVDAYDYSSLASWEAARKIYDIALSTDEAVILIDANSKNENLLMSVLGLFANDSNTELEILS